MSLRNLSPPSTGYNIVDIRTPDKGASNIVDRSERPPSPPTSEDAFSNTELKKTILDGLDQPLNCKSVPTYILYDSRGLRLFDEITYLDKEYYLTNAERDILVQRADEMVECFSEGSSIFELGAGSLRKTQVILQAIEKAKKNVSYYALDLDQRELERSLSFLGDFQYVKLVGLLGTYDQSVPWIKREFSDRSQKVFMWLGSSIGNQSRIESAEFLKSIQVTCMAPQDLFIIGFDKRNDTAKIELAYNDSQGVTREFIMNGLDHLNQIMDKKVIDRAKFHYHTKYQAKAGRHVAHYQALEDVTINYRLPEKNYQIQIKKNEMIHIEHSYKYSMNEIQNILSLSGLDMVECWEDSGKQYRLALTEKRPLHLRDDIDQVVESLVYRYTPNDPEYIECKVCNSDGEEKEMELKQSSRYLWPKSVATLEEWQELWKLTDVVTRQMINRDTMLFERPISLRHPFIFYLGHIPAFLDIQLARHQVDIEVNNNGGFTSPQYFADIFERGIDPDMDDPAQCNPHSEVPTEDKDWPDYDSIIEYQNKVRQRVERLLQFWESETQQTGKSFLDGHPERTRRARILFMCFEHEAMHIETLLYMLNQSNLVLPPAVVSEPLWKHKPYTSMTKDVLPDAPIIRIPGGTATLGHNDSESGDATRSDFSSIEFGWDNEHPQRQIQAEPFEIQSRPVTNGEYYSYYQSAQSCKMPASWCKKDGNIHVRTLFGPCPLFYAKDWPVQVSYNEALEYAHSKKSRIPTEPELVRFRDEIKTYKYPNIGFREWTPTNVDNEEVHVVGDAFELTSTVWDSHDGFESSEIYPGYSSDFFDGKHNVVLGGSWATHPRMAYRRSFRNWYQAAYPYVFSTFRLCN